MGKTWVIYRMDLLYISDIFVTEQTVSKKLARLVFSSLHRNKQQANMTVKLQTAMPPTERHA